MAVQKRRHRDAFAAAPDKYAPQFGGYCAWGGQPGLYGDHRPRSLDDRRRRLYLNYSKGVQAQWRQDIPGNIALGRENWPGVLDE